MSTAKTGHKAVVASAARRLRSETPRTPWWRKAMARFPRGKTPAHAGMGLRTLRILRRTARAFFEDNVTRLGAALAFYTTIAVAPLMFLTVALAGMLFEEAEAKETVVRELRNVVGDTAATAVASVGSPERRQGGIAATALGTVTLLFGGFGVFMHLQEALNSIWRVSPPKVSFLKLLQYRLMSLTVVVATGFILLVSLVVSAGISWAATYAMGKIELPELALQVVNAALPLMFITVLFALMFKLLPDTHVPWRHVWLGALVTAVLFTIGKTAMGIYLGRAAVTSAYGAAGSIIALLLWCYYAAQIVFLGAEFTRITTLSDGGRDFTQLNKPEERIRTAR